MRNILPVLIFTTLFAASAQAEQPVDGKAFKPETNGKLLPLKGAAAAGNSCAAYGAGFVRVEGLNTCVKVGGSVRIDAGGTR
jgi:hypothetical protein